MTGDKNIYFASTVYKIGQRDGQINYTKKSITNMFSGIYLGFIKKVREDEII